MIASAEVVGPSFSQSLRDRSWEFHQHAESAPYMTSLMKGELDLSGFSLMVVQHLFIYEALEGVGAALRDDPIAGRFITDRLTRTPHLRADLEDLLGPGWRAQVTPLPATERYVERIRRTSTWPGGFIAHHYTRYLGDLSGGLAIGAVVNRIYGLDGRGVSFYRFAQIDKPKQFKDAYRDQLDAVPWSQEEQARVIDEVLQAYRHNTDVFVELARAVGLEEAR